MRDIWLILAIALTAVVIITTPAKEIRRLLPLGLAGGALLTTAVAYIGGPLLRLWAFEQASNKVWGIPLFLILASIPGEMLYEKSFENRRTIRAQVGMVIVFALGVTILDWLATSMEALRHLRWPLYATFGLSGVLLTALAYYIDATRLTKEKRNT